MKKLWLLMIAGSVTVSSLLAVDVDEWTGSKVAVTAFPSGKHAESFSSTIQARGEQIASNNGLVPLDEKKASELKDVNRQLEDPDFILTADALEELETRYAIEHLVRYYVTADTAPGLAGYFVATAQADLRLVDSDAEAHASVSAPMGTPKVPPSEGLTEKSAIINAVLRAMDEGAKNAGFTITSPVKPSHVNIRLEGPVDLGLPKKKAKPINDKGLHELAELEQQRWLREKVTCTAVSPDGSLAAIAGYLIDTDFQRNPQRVYGSRLHLVNMEDRETWNIMECSPVAKKTFQEKGTKQILDCQFLKTWQHVAVITGNRILLYNTVLGQAMDEQWFPSPIKEGFVELVDRQGETYLVARSGKIQYAYKLVVER